MELLSVLNRSKSPSLKETIFKSDIIWNYIWIKHIVNPIVKKAVISIFVCFFQDFFKNVRQCLPDFLLVTVIF